MSQSQNLDDEIPSGVVSKRKAHENGASTLNFSPQGGFVATGGGDGCVKIWDIGHGSETKSIKIPLCKSISSMTYNQVGNVIACSGTDLEISLIRISG
jgi:WD40 repeat protein